jgi:hypothetical protein
MAIFDSTSVSFTFSFLACVVVASFLQSPQDISTTYRFSMASTNLDYVPSVSNQIAGTTSSSVTENDPVLAYKIALNMSVEDQGHRLGNFHNYYTFHPPSNRLDKMQSLIEHITTSSRTSHKRQCTADRKQTFHYCDLGCNEGDLTIEIASAIQSSLDQKLKFQGIDIDPKLIERANLKWKDTAEMTGHFQAGNLCCDLDSMLEDQSVDLVSLLSTTMWVHIHVGDEGLKDVLHLLCKKTRRFLLIEPQPSKCYRNALVRLRKMGRPEFDVTSERLHWRPTIEEEIQKTLEACGFRRVEETTSRTTWNREIQLYECSDDSGQDHERKKIDQRK